MLRLKVPTAFHRRSVEKEFRPDIEGLRAVAVLAVVLFHADLPGVGGGFVGVDVFFVISGFLITELLWREVSTAGTVGLRRFDGARARRLLPASTTVAITGSFSNALTTSAIIGNTMVYFDTRHLTREYSELLAPAMGALAERTLAQG